MNCAIVNNMAWKKQYKKGANNTSIAVVNCWILKKYTQK